MSEGSLDPQYLEAYRGACREATQLYAVAFDCMTEQLGVSSSLQLAPLLLPKVVAAAQQQAMERLSEQFNEELLRQQQQLSEEEKAQQDIRAENPW